MNEERLTEAEQNINNLLTRTNRLDSIEKSLQGQKKALSMLEEKMSALEADVNETIDIALHKIDNLKNKADDVVDLIKPKRWGRRYSNRFDEMEERIAKLEDQKQDKDPAERLFKAV